MSKIPNLIKYAFNKHPIISNSIVYGALFVGAEFSQQTISKKLLADTPLPYDTASISRCAIYGTTIQGPILTVWYRWLDRNFVGTSVKIITKKLLIDQFIMTPQLLIIFYISMAILERKKDLLEECKQKIIPTFKSSCMFWLPVQGINFGLIPSSFRVVYVGTCSFAWVNILCYIKSKEY